jgi:hypothetical protein
MPLGPRAAGIFSKRCPPMLTIKRHRCKARIGPRFLPIRRCSAGGQTSNTIAHFALDFERKESGFSGALFSALMALALFDHGAATAQEGKQIKLTEKHIQSFMGAYNDMVKLYESANPDKPDPKVEAQAEAIAKKNGFASLDEFDDVSFNISMTISGIDPQTKKFTEPPEQIRKEIAAPCPRLVCRSSSTPIGRLTSRKVRFTPESDRRADMPAGPSRADLCTAALRRHSTTAPERCRRDLRAISCNNSEVVQMISPLVSIMTGLMKLGSFCCRSTCCMAVSLFR